MIVTTVTTSMAVVQVYVLDFMRVVASVSVVVTMIMMVSVSVSMSVPMMSVPMSVHKCKPMMSVSASMATDFNVDSFGVVIVFHKFWHVDSEVHTEK